MSLEGTIRDLGLQEVGQLLSLSRKHGTLRVTSVLRGTAAWIRFSDGAIVDAGSDEPTPLGTATAAAAAGNRSDVVDAVLDVLSWREGHFEFDVHAPITAHSSQVRISTDAMLVESAQRDDAWRALHDRITSAEAVPAFVDVEPKSLPLLRLQPQEWEVLTRVDGERSVRTLARLMQRDVLDVAAIVHGLIGNRLLVISGLGTRRAAASTPVEASLGFASTTSTASAASAGSAVTLPASTHVALEGDQPSLNGEGEFADNALATSRVDWRADGDAAARRGDFQRAMLCWSAYLRTPHAPAASDQVREAISLAARLQSLLYPKA